MKHRFVPDFTTFFENRFMAAIRLLRSSALLQFLEERSCLPDVSIGA